jgi:hypothetical protein
VNSKEENSKDFDLDFVSKNSASALKLQISGGRRWGEKEVVSFQEVVFRQLPALQFQIPGWRRWGEERGRLLSITCSPVPDSWEEAAG